MNVQRSFVPFEGLWSMPIDVPYSFLVRDGDLAWSCGQLALDAESRVLAHGNLAAQSSVVSDYVSEILNRGGLSDAQVCRLLLYYVHEGDAPRDRMRDVFRNRFDNALVDAVAVPHYYYDGVMLETDVFCAQAVRDVFAETATASLRYVSTATHSWVSVACAPASVPRLIPDLKASLLGQGLNFCHLVSDHWFAPGPVLPRLAEAFAPTCLGRDTGALIDAGPMDDRVLGILLFAVGDAGEVVETFESDRGSLLLMRESPGLVWLRARSSVQGTGLIEQTRGTMAAIERKLEASGLSFAQVVKSTTHYAGGPTPDELHGNMRVRNAYYSKPGPASTGLPVFGFNDPACRVVVDVTLRR